MPRARLRQQLELLAAVAGATRLIEDGAVGGSDLVPANNHGLGHLAGDDVRLGGGQPDSPDPGGFAGDFALVDGGIPDLVGQAESIEEGGAVT